MRIGMVGGPCRHRQSEGSRHPRRDDDRRRARRRRRRDARRAQRDGRRGAEESVFHAVNDLPEGLYPALWPFQQLGALVLGPVVAVVALVLRPLPPGGRCACIVTVAQARRRAGRQAAVSRQRPGTSIGSDVALRGDVHARRRELRVRSRRARGGARRRGVPVPARAAGSSCRGCWSPPSCSDGCTSAPTTRSTSSAARPSASPSPGSSTSPAASAGSRRRARRSTVPSRWRHEQPSDGRPARRTGADPGPADGPPDRRRRRPSGAPPPLPRSIGLTGRGWLVARSSCSWRG